MECLGECGGLRGLTISQSFELVIKGELLGYLLYRDRKLQTSDHWLTEEQVKLKLEQRSKNCEDELRQALLKVDTR